MEFIKLDIVDYIKLAISFLVIFVMIFYSTIKKNNRLNRTYNTIIVTTLFFLTVLSFLTFLKSNYQYQGRGDLSNYYIGSKYFEYLDYENIYNCIIVARHENGQLTESDLQKYTCNTVTYSPKPISAVIEQADKYRNLFPQDKWTEFKTDIYHMTSIMTPFEQKMAITDGGYPGSPAFSVFAGLIARLIPIRNELDFTLLACLNLVFAMVTSIIVFKTFGLIPLLLCIIYFCIDPASNCYNTTYLRLDGLFVIISAMCFLKLKRTRLTAIVLSYGLVARLYPIYFVFCIGYKNLIKLIVTRKKTYLNFFIVFFAVSCFLLLLSIFFYENGVSRWLLYFNKVTKHSSYHLGGNISYVGFSNLLNNVNVFFPLNASFQSFLLSFSKVIFFIFTLYFLLFLKDYEVVPYSVLFYFIFSSMVFYYYSFFLLLLIIFYSEKIEKRSYSLGLVSIFFFPGFRYILRIAGPSIEKSYLLLNLSVFFIFIFFVVVLIKSNPLKNTLEDLKK